MLRKAFGIFDNSDISNPSLYSSNVPNVGGLAYDSVGVIYRNAEYVWSKIRLYSSKIRHRFGRREDSSMIV